MRKLTHEEVVLRQQEKLQQNRLPFIVVLNDIRSLYNVGSIFRSADGAGVSKIFCCGITGYPPNSQISKTALGAEEQIPWEYREDALSVIKDAKAQGYEVVLLEQTDQSVSYQSFKPQAPICLVIGNEIEGVFDSIVPFSDTAIEIEMEGVKNSLNVSVAFGVVAFHIKESLKQKALIKEGVHVSN